MVTPRVETYLEHQSYAIGVYTGAIDILPTESDRSTLFLYGDNIPAATRLTIRLYDSYNGIHFWKTEAADIDPTVDMESVGGRYAFHYPITHPIGPHIYVELVIANQAASVHLGLATTL